jgi:hypothetical protein
VLKCPGCDAPHERQGPMDFGKVPVPGLLLDLGDDDPKIFVPCRSASSDK